MDDRVLRGMARWPDVPAVYGWLELDEDGDWRIRGERIGHAPLRAFLGRNYAGGPDGRWYVQNGPQRVYVDLGYTPWVYRLHPEALSTHTDRPATPARAWLDDRADLLVETEHGIGLLARRDLVLLAADITGPDGVADADAVNAAARAAARGEHAGLAVTIAGVTLALGGLPRAQVPGRFGFDPHPRPPDEP